MNGDKLGPGPENARSGESLFETLQSRRSPLGELGSEADLRHGNERDDERSAFQQRPVARSEGCATSEQLGCGHARVDHNRPSTGRLWVAHTPAIAARKRASSSSVRPSITVFSYRSLRPQPNAAERFRPDGAWGRPKPASRRALPGVRAASSTTLTRLDGLRELRLAMLHERIVAAQQG